MNIKEIIDKKRLGCELSNDEIKYVVESYVDGSIPDYQMTALLMAICTRGMNFNETLTLTDTMLNSGEILDLSSIEGVVADKHSTGGIGDKVTLILAPILASCGVKVAKMSGRGLGFTGGTIDKLESIPNFNVNLTDTEFINEVNDIGMAISSATENIDIADKKIYALRDATSTVESIPLIASSIMSKKLASNADIIVIDVKVGSGALIKNKKDAKVLSRYLIDIGAHYNKKVFCLLTNMNQPLGHNIGNRLEVLEAIDALNGKGAKDLMEVVYSIASIIISAIKGITLDDACEECINSIKDKSAYNKFIEFVKYQHGDVTNLDTNSKVLTVFSNSTGYITDIDAEHIGMLALELGAGRISKEDSIDYDVGIILDKKVGDYVKEGDILGRIYYNNKEIDINRFRNCYTYSLEKIKVDTILGLIKV